MTILDQTDLAAAAAEPFAELPAPAAALPAVLAQRVREDLDALCRGAHDDALERLADEGRALCPNRAVQLAVYRSLRWFRSGEPLLRARFLAEPGGAAPAAQADALGLLDEDDLREGLAQATFVAQAQGTAGAPFAVLARALRESGVDEAAIAGLAPRELSRAYVFALDAFALDPEMRLELLRAMQARLLAALPACYRDWQRVLHGEPATADALEAPTGDAVAAPAANATWPRAALLHALAQMQSAPRDMDAAMASMPLADGLLRVLAADEPDAALRFAQADRAAIDLVDILFAMLVADAGFPPVLVADFLTLRVPFLALSLQDRAHLLERAGAPRRLLESLVRGVLGMDAGQPRGRHALACARAAIGAARTHCGGDAAACERVRTDFEKALAALPAQAQDGDDEAPRERRLSAWQAVAAAIGRELARTDLPPLVHALLRRPWAQSMARVALRHGEDSAEFRHAADVAAALCAAFAHWSTRPSLEPQHSQRAMHGLSSIAIDLRAGLERAGHGARQVVELWQHLTRLIVQPARDEPLDPPLPMLGAGPDIDTALRELEPPVDAPAPPPLAALRLGQIVEMARARARATAPETVLAQRHQRLARVRQRGRRENPRTARHACRPHAGRRRARSQGRSMTRFMPALALAFASFAAAAANPPPLATPDLRIKLDGTVSAMARQSDGDIVVGGFFTSINGEPRANLALIRPDGSLDPDWNPGVHGSVDAVAVGPDDAVYVAGYFDHIDGVARNHLAKLGADDGAVVAGWDAGLMLTPTLLALTMAADGDLFVGGDFRLPGNVLARVAKLSDSDATPDANWSSAAQPRGTVFALAVDAASGALYVGGTFDQIGGVARDNLAQLAPLDGTLLSFAPQPDSLVTALLPEPSSGSLYVAGEFSSIAGSARRGVAKLDAGSGALRSWDAKSNHAVYALHPAHGALYVGGLFTDIGGLARARAARLSSADASVDAAWAPLYDGAFDQVRAFATLGDEVLAGGVFARVSGKSRLGLARIDGNGVPGARLDAERRGVVHAAAAMPDGGWVIGGEFFTVDGSPRRNLARVSPDGTLDPAWIADTQGVGALAGRVFALAVHRVQGYVVAGGEFQGINGTAVKHLAKLASDTGAVDPDFMRNPTGIVRALAFDPNFRLYAGGQFAALVDENNVAQTREQLARFRPDGSLDPDWAPPVRALVRAIAFSGANLYVGGDFLLRKYNTVDGTRETFPDHPSGSVFALATDGVSVYAGGDFSMVGGETRQGLARLATDGSIDAGFVPSMDPSTLVDSLLLDGAGSLYVGGLFAQLGGQPASNLARLAADTGVAHALWQPAPDGTVYALRRRDDGRIAAAGEFGEIGGVARDAFAVLGRLAQSIVFDPAPAPFTYGGAGGNVSANASSGLPVTYGTTTPALCSVDAATGKVTVLGAGDCIVTADRDEDEEFDAAPQATQNVVIQKAAQSALTVSATPATLAVGATSALAVGGGSGTGAFGLTITAGDANCEIAGTTLTALAAGTCTVTATRAGDANHLPASASTMVTVTAPDGNALFRNGFEG